MSLEEKGEEKGEVNDDSRPHDVSRCEMWRGILLYLKRGNHIPGWMFSEREYPFGYWSDRWYYRDQLIYLEEYNDYDGKHTMDYTTYEVWYSSDRQPATPTIQGEINNRWIFHPTSQPFVINENS